MLDLKIIRVVARRLGLAQCRSGRRAGGRQQRKRSHAGKQTDERGGKGITFRESVERA
jgi:hypothetical protein